MSIVNNTALAIFWYNVKNYISNCDANPGVIKLWNPNNPTTGWHAGTNYILRFQKMTTNRYMHFSTSSNQSGVVVCDEAGKYFFVAQIRLFQNSGSNANAYPYLKLFSPATGKADNTLSGTEICQSSNYTYNNGSSNPVTITLSNEIDLAVGDTLAFAGAINEKAGGITLAGCHAIFIKCT